MEDIAGVVRLGMPSNQRPESKDLQRFLTDYCKHWRDIGVLLELKSPVLDLVASAHPMNDRECFRATLEKWLQLNVEVTWANLELAITNANRESLGLQPLTTVLPRMVLQPENNQERQVEETKQRKSTNAGVTNEMTEGNGCIEVKKRFRDCLVTDLRMTYSKVVKKLIHIFKEKKVDIEELITILRFDDVNKQSVFSTDDVFKTIRTEIQLFQNVANYCKGIYDYRVLNVLVQASECPEAIKELTNFTKLLQNSVLTEIDLMSEHGELLHPDDFMSGTYKFVIKYVGGKCTIETKEMVQGIVEQCVRLEKGSLIFKGVDMGSILLIYQISETVKNYLLQYKFTEQDVRFLEENNITSLIVDGVEIIGLSQPNKELQHSEGAAQLERMISKQLNNLVTSLSPKDQEATLSTLKRIFDNIIQYPNDDKYRQIKLTDETFTSKVWQYPAGEELMKMSGWEVEGGHVRLRDDSCVQIVSQLLKSFLSSSATGVVPFPDDEFQVLIKALYNDDIACIQKLLKVSHISPNGRIYSESGSSLNLLEAATIAQQLDIVKLLLTDYSMDPYVSGNTSFPFIVNMFYLSPPSFIIAIMKYCGVKADFKTTEGLCLLHFAIIFNCFDVVSFLLEDCSGIDVNVTTEDDSYTPLHLAYLYGHTQIAEYLIQHGADVYAVDSDDYIPCQYIDGDPDFIKDSQYLQIRRKIHHIPYSIEHCYYMKLRNNGNDNEEAVSLTMEQFPSLIEDGPTRPPHDIDHASALKEFTQYITYSSQKSSGD